MIRIDLPWPKPPLTGNDRGHTRYSPFTRVKGEAQTAIRNAKVRAIVGADVTLHWLIPTRGRRDSDNLGPTLKACLDALVAERVLPDDSWVHVPRSGNEIHPPTGEPPAMWLTLTGITEYEAAS
jgi:Holliday junction resolvase RusA-like endonuclease